MNMKNKRIISSVITGLLVFSLMVHAEETRGAPDVEYPNYHTVPKTSFTCSGKKHIPGFYADMETDCQVFHFCEENRQESFLCPTGTTFNQASLECEPWDSSNCSLSPQFYSVNSGPKMEDSRRDIFMALHLKSKSRSRLYINPSDVYRKITSLYDDSEIDEQPTKFKGVRAYVNADSNNKISHKQEISKEAEDKESEDRKESLSQFIEGLDENMQNDGTANEYGMVPSDINESYDIEPEIFYDPVTEKYYEYSDEMVDQYNDFKYGGFENRYGVAYDGYADVVRSDPEREVSQEGIQGIEEFNQVSDIDGTSQSENGQLDTQQPPRRIRRKPTYVVVQDGYQVAYAGDGSFPIENSAEQYTTESTHTDDSSELLEEASSEGNDVQEQADSDAPFETYEYQNQGDEPRNVPGTSQTSEEYEEELLAQLSLLGIKEYDPDQPFEEEQRDGEFEVPEDYQSDDEYSYVENAIPPDYESYSVQYNGDSRFSAEQESYQQTQDSEEISNWYQGDESLSVESGESDDSHVIPDESDTGVSGQDSEDEEVKTYDAEGFDAYWRNYFAPTYVYPTESPVGPYLFPVARYFPSGYRLNRQISNADYFRTRFLRPTPAVSGTPNDQQFQYVSDAGISPEGYYTLHDSSYSDYFPSNVVGRAYDYAAEYGYPYANVYANLYGGGYGYDASEETETIGSPVLDGNAVDAMHADAGDYYESEMQPWMQTEASEMDDGMLVTESSIPTEEAIADLYATMSSDGIDVNEVPSEVSSPDQAEEFYLFDFDEDNEEKSERDTTGVSETDAEQLGTKELFQTEESLLHNDSLKDSKGGPVDSVLKSSENTLTSDELSRGNVKPVDGAESANAENVRLNVDLLSALNPVRASRSNIGNTNLFDDSTTSYNKIYPESSVQPKGDVERFSMASNVDSDFLARAGDTGNPTASKLSEIQERIRSLKKGKFGAFKKYVSSGEIKS